MYTGFRAAALRAEDAAARLHHEQLRAATPASARRRLDPLEVALDDRPDHGVDDGRGGAEVLAELGRDLGRERDRHARQLLGEDRADAPLVLGVDVGVQQADRDRLDALAPQERGRRRAPTPSSSGDSTSPCGPSRSRTSKRGRAGRAAAASRTACRRASGRIWRAISSMSRKPSVVTKPLRAILPSMIAFVATVVAWTTKPTCAALRRRRRRARARRPCMKPSDGSAGVVEHLGDRDARRSPRRSASRR